jgi:hypothetical protein
LKKGDVLKFGTKSLEFVEIINEKTGPSKTFYDEE